MGGRERERSVEHSGPSSAKWTQIPPRRRAAGGYRRSRSDDRSGGKTFKADKTTGAASGGDPLTRSIHQKHSRGACTQSHAASLRTPAQRNRKSGSRLHVQRTDISQDMKRLRAACVAVSSSKTFKRACLNSKQCGNITVSKCGCCHQ